MIKIHPTIEFTAQCPQEGSDLEIKRVIIPGMRCLADTICPSCGTPYYIDLPVSHALWSPTILNQKTGEIYDPLHLEWLNKPLQEGFKNPDSTDIIPIVHQFFERERIIIINCLDFIYGHSLLKLLNVQRYLDAHPELGCCVLVPSQLTHLVPEGVAEIWEFSIPFKAGLKWYLALQDWISQKISQYQECFLSPAYSHPSHAVYDLSRFVRDLPDISSDINSYQPIILFSYREDRLWGKKLKDQQNRLQQLYEKLSFVFPEMLFVIIGFGHQIKIQPTGSELRDLRRDQFEVESDKLWLAYMKVADCAIGVHGSNMLLPSGLAKATLELLPYSRLGNSYQDLLFPHHLSDLREAFLRYRFLYGNDHLSDISVEQVMEIVTAILAHNSINTAWFKLGEGDSTTFEYSLSSVAQQALRYHPEKSIPKKVYQKIQEIFKSQRL